MRRLLPAALAALACAACTVPAFDLVMSRSGRTLDLVPVVAVVGPLPAPGDFDLRRDSFTFLPERTLAGLDIMRGFVLRTTSWGETEIWYQWPRSGATAWLRGPSGAGYRNDGQLPWVWPVSLKTGSYLGAFVFDSDQYATWIERLWADTAMPQLIFFPPPHAIDPGSLIKVALSLSANTVVVGMSLNADTLPGQDRFYALVRDDSTPPKYTEATCLFDFNGFFSPPVSVMGTNYPLPFLGTGIRHCIYFHDSNAPGRSFAQWYDQSSGWHTWSWWTPTNNAALANANHRIDAVLSSAAGPAGTSYLLSTEDQAGRIYSYDGTVDRLVAEFPLGTLKFIGEVFLGGTWKLLFTRWLADVDARSLWFEIRAIDTASVVSTFPPP